MNNLLITIDPRKHRIRFFKTLLSALGNPKYIQLMVNVEKKLLIVRYSEKEDRSTIKICSNIEKNDCYEVYSMKFIHKLLNLIGSTDNSNSYRLSGLLSQAERVVVFPLTLAQKIDPKDEESYE